LIGLKNILLIFYLTSRSYPKYFLTTLYVFRRFNNRVYIVVAFVIILNRSVFVVIFLFYYLFRIERRKRNDSSWE